VPQHLCGPSVQLQASARQVEGMVRAKMEQKEYIILCLE